MSRFFLVSWLSHVHRSRRVYQQHSRFNTLRDVSPTISINSLTHLLSLTVVSEAPRALQVLSISGLYFFTLPGGGAKTEADHKPHHRHGNNTSVTSILSLPPPILSSRLQIPAPSTIKMPFHSLPTEIICKFVTAPHKLIRLAF